MSSRSILYSIFQSSIVILFLFPYSAFGETPDPLDGLGDVIKVAKEMGETDSNAGGRFARRLTGTQEYGIKLLNASAALIKKAYRDAKRRNEPVDSRATQGEYNILSIARDPNPKNFLRRYAITALSLSPSDIGIQSLLEIAKGAEGYGYDEPDRIAALETLEKKPLMGFFKRPIIDVCRELIEAGKTAFREYQSKPETPPNITAMRLMGRAYRVLAKLGEPSTLEEILGSGAFFAGDIDLRMSLSSLTLVFKGSLQAQNKFLTMTEYQRAIRILDGYEINPPKLYFDAIPERTEEKYKAEIEQDVAEAKANLKALLQNPATIRKSVRTAPVAHF